MVIRDPTKQEIDMTPTGVEGDTVGFIPIARQGGIKVKSPEAQLSAEISKYQLEANQKGLPFAAMAVRNDFKERMDNWEKEWKRQGFTTKEKPSFKEIDWKKYSDLKNFELIDEGEQFDMHLSKRHSVDIMVKFKKYKYKGYRNTFTIMESGNLAVQRAKKEK